MTQWGRALRHRNFRRYFIGQSISILGTWMQIVAMSWLVYRLTGSAALLGITAFLAQAPQLVVSPLAGVWIDRFNRRRMLLVVQSLFIAQSLLLALLTFTGLVESWHLLLLAASHGMLNSIDTPLRQSLLIHLVDDRRDLQNAVALNASAFNVGRLIGPPVAGLLLGFTSEGVCFLLNGLSFLALVIALWPVRVEVIGQGGSIAAAFREGIRYAQTTSAVSTVLLSLALLNVTASAYIVLMPVFAKEVFHGDSRTLGWLLGAAGAGALLATAWLASHRASEQMARSVMLGWILCTSGLLGFGATDWLALALTMMFLLGAGITTTNVATNAMLQDLTPDHLRGRVISFFSALRFGMDAVGGLIAGVVASQIGAPATVLLEGTLVALGLVLLAPRLRALRREARLRHQAVE